MTNPDFKQGTTLAGKLLYPPASTPGLIQPTFTIAEQGSPTGGTFTLTVTVGVGPSAVSATTGNIAYNASAATVQTALTGLSNVGGSNATVTGTGPWTVTFANLGPASMAITPSLTGGSNPTATVTGVGVSTTVYTVPASTAAKIASLSIYNAGNTTATVLVSVVPSGGTVDGTHVIAGIGTGATTGLVAGDSTKITEIESAPLNAGAFISVNTTQPLCLVLTGYESA